MSWESALIIRRFRSNFHKCIAFPLQILASLQKSLLQRALELERCGSHAILIFIVDLLDVHGFLLIKQKYSVRKWVFLAHGIVARVIFEIVSIDRETVSYLFYTKSHQSSKSVITCFPWSLPNSRLFQLHCAFVILFIDFFSFTLLPFPC